eukprot:sb/3471290/
MSQTWSNMSRPSTMIMTTTLQFICLLQFLVVSVSGLQCFICKEDQLRPKECEQVSHPCFGDCAYIITSNSSVFGAAETTIERLCIPSAMTNEQVCLVERTKCVKYSPDCTCTITRCTNDLCNGFDNYGYARTELPQMIVDNKDNVDNTQTLRNTLNDEDGTDAVFNSADRCKTALLLLFSTIFILR